MRWSTVDADAGFRPREVHPPCWERSRSEQRFHVDTFGLPGIKLSPLEYSELYTVHHAWRVRVLQIHRWGARYFRAPETLFHASSLF